MPRATPCLPAHRSTLQGWAALLMVPGWRCWGEGAAQAGSVGQEAAGAVVSACSSYRGGFAPLREMRGGGALR